MRETTFHVVNDLGESTTGFCRSCALVHQDVLLALDFREKLF